MFKSWRFVIFASFVALLALVCPTVRADEVKPTNNQNPPVPKLKTTETSLAKLDTDWSIVISPDSRHIAWIIKVYQGKEFIAVDGVKGTGYDVIWGPTLQFSPDSKHFAYAARRGDKGLVIFDGTEGKEYDRDIDHPVIFSPDSNHIAYPAQRGANRVVVTDHAEGKEYDAIEENTIVFSPDSKRLVSCV
jgi:hypothetical protein